VRGARTLLSPLLPHMSSQETICQETICAALKSTGSCNNPACPFLHDLYTCDVCSMSWDNKKHYDSHFNQPRHVKRARRGGGGGGAFFCPICRATIPGAGNWAGHLGGKRHVDKSERAGVDPARVEPEDPPLPVDHVRCNICEYFVPADRWAAHTAQRNHKLREGFITLRSVLEDAAKDRNGVSISHAEGGIDFGIVEVAEAVVGLRVEVTVKVTDRVARIRLLGVKMASPSTAASRCAYIRMHVLPAA
jgi:helicase MOV-10